MWLLRHCAGVSEVSTATYCTVCIVCQEPVLSRNTVSSVIRYGTAAGNHTLQVEISRKQSISWYIGKPGTKNNSITESLYYSSTEIEEIIQSEIHQVALELVDRKFLEIIHQELPIPFHKTDS